ncbi:Dihydrofolate reductase domain protein [Kalmanozyma brasiliensis GHG001]|uniref:Dihydrofolate reductase domain protein n=1 Tax=Kalmanozyma brasiliensis (strain GHG001) TaxID=1365824 RepID=UPI0028682C30|nr:Dihydrofolate reductase domain protein [Kalmanozyma brasiliensis GHG001]KAF6767566.1 Dihydrofolate reductase domain protein [Kalmanozyma brasiliensis GHG001]
MPKLKLATVAAMSLTNGVGKDGGLPWRLKGEMAYFRKVTSHVPEEAERTGARNAVIMGRKTWASIPPKFRPLNGRLNVVISRTSSPQDLGIEPDSKDVKVFSSVEQALSHLATPQANVIRVFVIGGAQLWTDLLHLESSVAVVDKLLVTRILTPRYECDVYFPEFRTQEQYSKELDQANKILAGQEKSNETKTPHEGPSSLLKQQAWTQASVEALRQYLGSACPPALAESPDMLTNEGETWYEYQLWEKTG